MFYIRLTILHKKSQYPVLANYVGNTGENFGKLLFNMLYDKQDSWGTGVDGWN